MELNQLELPASITDRIQFWLSEAFDTETRDELQALIDKGELDELYDRFYKDLEFGTGGIRGKIGAGTNRMNRYVVGMATQGLANYIIQQTPSPEERKVVIAYDSRQFSKEFAEETALVLAGNGIKAYIFDELRPTPELSFAVRYLRATAGVVITASHNPKEYNGYKVYWSDGAQIVPPHDRNIINEVRKITSIEQVKRLPRPEAEKQGLLEIIGDSIDEAYLEAIKKISITPHQDRAYGGEIKIIYTPLHGTGIKLVPRALAEWGFSNVMVCDEQAQPDGNFPTVKSPNPEEPVSLIPAISFAKEQAGDILLANDPDCDRLGVVCRQADGEYKIITGNQLSSMLCYFIFSELQREGRLPERPAVVTTIVTTRMIEAIASSFGAHTEYTLTGFKWICEKARLWESDPQKYSFLYGTEESLGHVVGTSVRDKDGVIAACVTAELALWAKLQKRKTLLEFMDELYQQYGVFTEETHSIYLTGAEGQKTIENVMEMLRNTPPPEIGGLAVEFITDVKLGKRINAKTGEKVSDVSLPVSNVLMFTLAQGHTVVARPSGTEPKLKLYFLLQDTENLPIPTPEQLAMRKQTLQKQLEILKTDFLNTINSLINSCKNKK